MKHAVNPHEIEAILNRKLGAGWREYILRSTIHDRMAACGWNFDQYNDEWVRDLPDGFCADIFFDPVHALDLDSPTPGRER